MLDALPALHRRVSEAHTTLLKKDSHQGSIWVQSQSSSNRFGEEFKVLLHKMRTILEDSLDIKRQESAGSLVNPRLIEQLIYMVAEAFGHITDIRLQWLQKLADHHSRYENFAEAGQCYLAMARLSHSRINDSVLSSLYDEESTVQYFEKACAMLDSAQLYEQCHDVFKDLVLLYQKRNNYSALSRCYGTLHSIFEKLLTAEKTQSRMLGTYYRVGFYGAKFGERFDGKEFVFKTPKITRLPEISSELKKYYASVLGCPIKVLPDSGHVDLSKLDNKEDCVLQITCLIPVVNSEKSSFIEKNTKLSCFKYSTPFTKSGKAIGGTATQYHRVTLLHVKHTFPYMKTLQPVSLRQEYVLSPIEVATDNIRGQVNRINEVINAEKVEKQMLGQILLGSVATSVNGGVLEVCQAFFGETLSGAEESESKYDSKLILELKIVMHDFLACAQRALDCHRHLSDSDAALQAACDESFDKSREVMMPLIALDDNESRLRHSGNKWF